MRQSFAALALLAAVPTSGCVAGLAAGAAGATVGVAGAVIGTTAKVAVKTTGAVINAATPGGKNDDKEKADGKTR